MKFLLILLLFGILFFGCTQTNTSDLAKTSKDIINNPDKIKESVDNSKSETESTINKTIEEANKTIEEVKINVEKFNDSATEIKQNVEEGAIKIIDTATKSQQRKGEVSKEFSGVYINDYYFVQNLPDAQYPYSYKEKISAFAVGHLAEWITPLNFPEEKSYYFDDGAFGWTYYSENNDSCGSYIVNSSGEIHYVPGAGITDFQAIYLDSNGTYNFVVSQEIEVKPEYSSANDPSCQVTFEDTNKRYVQMTIPISYANVTLFNGSTIRGSTTDPSEPYQTNNRINQGLSSPIQNYNLTWDFSFPK
ncbi:MAG: methyl-accepting chemotaxis protein [Candidatus Micrarchaeota archaeon]|nr:methyl-accepting chemotaxis protein [Candidatus Micrarchaeota archaeon]